jgi:phosphate/sulfate permease/DNA-binding CsgD family transcriptional regulator
MITLLFFLSSGLFLGWSLGANDAANVFGTAVGSRMVKFKKAAFIASVFVILGAVIQGAGASDTLGKLGSVSKIAGAFTVALSAGLTVYWMTRFKLPVSTSQAIVGAIIGWNFYTNNPTDVHVLTRIVTTWISGPVLGAVFAAIMYLGVKKILEKRKLHLIYRDLLIRLGLIVVGAFGAYSLGANNIANVMGVFTTSIRLPDVDMFFFTLTGKQQLFAIGGIAIAIGIITYSKRVMETVGNTLMPINPEAALVVVLAQAIVLFIFSSQTLSNALQSLGLPSIPLVPVSSSQVVIGAIIGIGLLKGGKQIKFGVLGSISVGWVATPLIAGLVSFFLLFFVHNVFQQDVGAANTLNQKQTVIKNTVNRLSDQTDTVSIAVDRGKTKGETVLHTDRKNNSYYMMVSLVIILLLIIVTLLYFNRKNLRKRRQCLDKLSTTKQKLKMKIESLEKKLLDEQKEQDELDRELKYKDKELEMMAANIVKKYEFVSLLKDDIKEIRKGIKDTGTRQSLNDLVLKINQNLYTDRDKKKFEMIMQEQSTGFLRKLELKYPGLTDNEKRLIILLRMNLSSKEIASILNISPKSVEMSRYRLRKKLQVPPKINLKDFFENF